MATKGLVILFCLLSYVSAQRWRSDGRCGPNYPAPDANPGECNPNAVYNKAGGSSSGGSTSLVSSGSCPRIVTKSEWGSRATNYNVMLNLPVPKASTPGAQTSTGSLAISFGGP
ncbi:Hypp5851 [Branchiostoma lanceolatum]|uniref:Hypp5851 protein n=1 Tax=Branchiostoma lanceolatum TaxID=7740 RepID=A0A8J9VGR8_BRALA|nr:Hypp5851 [Branchiostoma lanceolatum]